MRALPGQHLVQNQPERVDVALHADLAARQLLRRHVGRRPGASGAGSVLLQHGEAEVGEAHLAGAVEHHVAGLEVAMQDAGVMRRRQAGADLPRDVDGLVLGQPPDPPQQRREILAVDELHGQERLAAEVADVVDATDVGLAAATPARVSSRERPQEAQKRFWGPMAAAQRGQFKEPPTAARRFVPKKPLQDSTPRRFEPREAPDPRRRSAALRTLQTDRAWLMHPAPARSQS
jgi:hypothetical protein